MESSSSQRGLNETLLTGKVVEDTFNYLIYKTLIYVTLKMRFRSISMTLKKKTLYSDNQIYIHYRIIRKYK